jgi:uncharacterized protein (DUF2235 family)
VQPFKGRFLNWLRLGRKVEVQMPPRVTRGHTTHVILLDGTMSSLEPGDETNIGKIYRLLHDAPSAAPTAIYYEAGVQWQMWRDIADVAMGRGIDDQILRAYGWLASHYKPGDRIFLMGFSRGAFAVRSLAGVIDRVGLLTARDATERNIRLAYRYYQAPEVRTGSRVFRERFCHPQAAIDMIGVFDTVKALGVRLPLLWMLTEPQHRFHDQSLSRVVRHGYQALALDETRDVFAPILWKTVPGWQGRVEQVWFRGAHGDVGGHLGGYNAARPLANIPLVWMLERAQGCGLPLPDGWRAGFPTDPAAPSVGTTHGWGKMFLFRSKREVGGDPSESLHPTATSSRRAQAMLAVPGVGRPT